MIVILSPSKTLDLESVCEVKVSAPDFLNESNELIGELRKLSAPDISELMGVSEKIANLNFDRFKEFKTPFTEKNARPAIFTFKGDVYEPLEIAKYKAKEFEYLQKHVRILSGLYGILRPLDLMQAYRLEMGTVLKNARGKNLYEFWGSKVTDSLKDALSHQRDGKLINLASNEYSKVVDLKSFKDKLVTIHFKENKGGTYSTIGLFAKRARGLMANFMVLNNIHKVADLKEFDRENYKFSPKLSNENDWIFTRG